MNFHKHLRALTTVFLVVVLLVTACAPKPTPTPVPTAKPQVQPTAAPTAKPTEAPPKVLRFGAAIELTGARATEGKVLKDGMDFWVDYTNSHGGINIGGEKYMVEIKYYDDESDPQTAAKLTEKLITEDGTKFLMGPFSSAMTIATCAIGEKYQAITVAPLANAPSIYSQGYRYVFSVLPPATNYLKLLIEMLGTAVTPKPKTVALLAPDEPFGVAAADGSKMWAEQQGMQVVLYEKFPFDTKDLSSVLTKVKALNPDVVLGHGQFAAAQMITRQAKELGLCPKVLGFTVGPAFPDFTKSLGADAEYVYGSEWWLPGMGWKCPVFGSSQNYAELFQAKYGVAPGYHAASGTATGLLYQFALEKAGTTDVNKVRDALASLDLEFFWGPTGFNERGENVRGSSAPIQIQDGKQLGVWPLTFQQAPPRYPMPCWTER